MYIIHEHARTCLYHVQTRIYRFAISCPRWSDSRWLGSPELRVAGGRSGNRPMAVRPAAAAVPVTAAAGSAELELGTQ